MVFPCLTWINFLIGLQVVQREEGARALTPTSRWFVTMWHLGWTWHLHRLRAVLLLAMWIITSAINWINHSPIKAFFFFFTIFIKILFITIRAKKVVIWEIDLSPFVLVSYCKLALFFAEKFLFTVNKFKYGLRMSFCFARCLSSNMNRRNFRFTWKRVNAWT